MILFIIIVTAILGCEKDRLKDDLYSPFEKNSGVEIFTIDSVKIFPISSTNKAIYCYFRIDNSLFKDTALLSKIVLYKNGELRNRWDLKSTYFFDFSAESGNSYTYNLALEDIYGFTSKLSNPILVIIP